mmetsp:Transcript_6986/g.20787  ORF Transcript_6986/g.20787 Transcript_6986/m.20787 type:complete len:258 (-) Transcript_6986:1610-2383(-)
MQLEGQGSRRNGPHELEHAHPPVGHAHALDVAHKVLDAVAVYVLCGGEMLQSLLQLPQLKEAIAVRVPMPEGARVRQAVLGNVLADPLRQRAPLVHGGRVPAHDRQAQDGVVKRQRVLAAEAGHRLVQSARVERRHVQVEHRQEVGELLLGDASISVRVQQPLQAVRRGVEKLPPQLGHLAEQVRDAHGLVRSTDLKAVQEPHVPDGVSQVPRGMETLERRGGHNLRRRVHRQRAVEDLLPAGLADQARQVRVVVAE